MSDLRIVDVDEIDKLDTFGDGALDDVYLSVVHVYDYLDTCQKVDCNSVGYVTNSGLSAVFDLGVNLDDDTPLYTTPQPDRVAELEAKLNEIRKCARQIHEADDKAGCGFYMDHKWRELYEKLKQLGDE